VCNPLVIVEYKVQDHAIASAEPKELEGFVSSFVDESMISWYTKGITNVVVGNILNVMEIVVPKICNACTVV
jgi:hypothetical protein